MHLEILARVGFSTCCIIMICFSNSAKSAWPAHEESSEYWNKLAQDSLRNVLQRKMPGNIPAKNVILFIGDGMDLSTMTAGRIFKGQRRGQSGEETITSLDKFPNVGLSKIYTIDKQTPDSAGTATAIMCGIKTRFKLLGLNGKAMYGNCLSSHNNHVNSILEDSALAGKSTGIVTTTEVQHATPAAAYAHASSRNWVADSEMDVQSRREGCKDIALQLFEMGEKINVILGGGRANMRPSGIRDEEYRGATSGGVRLDRRNLIREWKRLHNKAKNKAKYVWNKTAFNRVNPNTTDYLMGLFEPFEMKYEHERASDRSGEPSLTQMTIKAIEILRKNSQGFFLLVEGGKIDHAHHANMANTAFREYLQLEKSIQAAINMTSQEDTLIVVTADHGHVFTFGGYSDRGNPLQGFARSQTNPSEAQDSKYYTSIAYGNGPGYQGRVRNRNRLSRESLTRGQSDSMRYRFQTAVPLPFETHSAEDTIVLARGPMSHLFNGVYEQNYIAHAMRYASCVGSYPSVCTDVTKISIPSASLPFCNSTLSNRNETVSAATHELSSLVLANQSETIQDSKTSASYASSHDNISNYMTTDNEVENFTNSTLDENYEANLSKLCQDLKIKINSSRDIPRLLLSQESKTTIELTIVVGRDFLIKSFKFNSNTNLTFSTTDKPKSRPLTVSRQRDIPDFLRPAVYSQAIQDYKKKSKNEKYALLSKNIAEDFVSVPANRKQTAASECETLHSLVTVLAVCSVIFFIATITLSITTLKYRFHHHACVCPADIGTDTEGLANKQNISTISKCMVGQFSTCSVNKTKQRSLAFQTS